MDDIKAELINLENELNSLPPFSNACAKKLQLLLEQYDGVVEHLYGSDQQLYGRSAECIKYVENKIEILTSKGSLVANKRNNFNKIRRRLLRSVKDDLYNYEVKQGDIRCSQI